MPVIVSLADAQAMYPEYTFIAALTPSAQKAAFHVCDSSGADLCLKIIGPNYEIDRLQREVQALQALSHPNIAQFREYEFSSRQGQQRHHLMEEFIEGSDLSARLVIGQKWTSAEGSSCFAALCDGLAELLNMNIVHRDLKPSNIRVRPDGSPVIIDFGLARHLDLSDLTDTSDGAAIGTPNYFAPEQFQGTKHDIDHRTDLFALGIIIYHAMTGQHPFWQSGMTRQQLRDAVCSSIDYLSEADYTSLSPQWRLIIARLLEKERVRRPQSAAQVAAILRKL